MHPNNHLKVYAGLVQGEHVRARGRRVVVYISQSAGGWWRTHSDARDHHGGSAQLWVGARVHAAACDREGENATTSSPSSSFGFGFGARRCWLAICAPNAEALPCFEVVHSVSSTAHVVDDVGEDPQRGRLKTSCRVTRGGTRMLLRCRRSDRSSCSFGIWCIRQNRCYFIHSRLSSGNRMLI